MRAVEIFHRQLTGSICRGWMLSILFQFSFSRDYEKSDSLENRAATGVRAEDSVSGIGVGWPDLTSKFRVFFSLLDS